MDHKIIVREKKEIDNDQVEYILNKNFGENRHQRTVYLYRKKSPIKVLSLVSCLNKIFRSLSLPFMWKPPILYVGLVH